jgi:hypothetical protein
LNTNFNFTSCCSCHLYKCGNFFYNFPLPFPHHRKHNKRHISQSLPRIHDGYCKVLTPSQRAARSDVGQNNFTGRDYVPFSNTDNVMEALTSQPGRDGSGVYSVKLVARTSTSFRLRLTRTLLEKLGTVKTDWPGWNLEYEEVQYEFLVEEGSGSPISPAFSPTSPAFNPVSPNFTPMSPQYQGPVNSPYAQADLPHQVPVSPFVPGSPRFTPTGLGRQGPGTSPKHSPTPPSDSPNV